MTTTDDKVTGNVLVSKLAKILAHIERVPKRGFNSFHNYKYVTESDMLDEVRGRLAELGIFVFSSVDKVESREFKNAKGNPQFETTVTLSHTFVDSETNESFFVRSAGVAHDQGDKAIYKAVTGAMKYFVMKNFWVPTGDDPEQDDEQEARERAKSAPRGRPDSKPVGNTGRPPIAPPRPNSQGFLAIPAEGSGSFAVAGVKHIPKDEKHKEMWIVSTVPDQYDTQEFWTFSSTIAKEAIDSVEPSVHVTIEWTTAKGKFLTIQKWYIEE